MTSAMRCWRSRSPHRTVCNGLTLAFFGPMASRGRNLVNGRSTMTLSHKLNAELVFQTNSSYEYRSHMLALYNLSLMILLILVALWICGPARLPV